MPSVNLDPVMFGLIWVKIFAKIISICRPPDKSVYWKIIFFISHQKHMLWVPTRNYIHFYPHKIPLSGSMHMHKLVKELVNKRLIGHNSIT